jgi:D-alanyl-D-alanine carboxypeptidase (penicillin-binding protein 5/6)
MESELQEIENKLDAVFEDAADDPKSHPYTSRVPILPQLSIALGLLVLVFGITYVGTTDAHPKAQLADIRVETLPPKEDENTLPAIDAFKDTRIQARAAIVWDVGSQKVLFNKNADDKLPLASITKLMTALVAYELLDPQDRITVTEQALKTDGDSGFVDGESFTMQNLADLTLISSSNDGATALGASAGKVISKTSDPNQAFVTAMNLKAEELGLAKTHFSNSTGLDVSENEAGAYGSARDVALLMEHIITHVTDAVALTNLEIKAINNDTGEYHIAKNTNESVTDIDGLIASKTGYTALAGGNLAVAFNAGLNRPIIIVVLGSSQNGRFEDTLELEKRARIYIDNELE